MVKENLNKCFNARSLTDHIKICINAFVCVCIYIGIAQSNPKKQ